MNYDLFPVVGSLSFLHYVPRISNTHTHKLYYYTDIPILLCAVYTDGSEHE